jgi:hypothetical protein
MREFTNTEYNTIKGLKWRCNKKEGESQNLTRTRYETVRCGHLPGTWMKTDGSIKFDAEIAPADEENTLCFRISGCVPEFVDGKPVCSFKDIINCKMDYSVDRHLVWRHPAGNAGDPYQGECDVEVELKTVIGRFFMLLENICCCYAYTLLAMKQGYRFTGMDEPDGCTAYLHGKPEDFMK